MPTRIVGTSVSSRGAGRTIGGLSVVSLGFLSESGTGMVIIPVYPDTPSVRFSPSYSGVLLVVDVRTDVTQVTNNGISAVPVEALLRRPSESPRQEFLLTAIEEQLASAEPTIPPSPILSIDDSMDREALLLTELIDLVSSSAPDFVASVPETISTKDYLDSIGKTDSRSNRLRNNYERSMLSICGLQVGIPVLGLPDLHAARDMLFELQAASEQLSGVSNSTSRDFTTLKEHVVDHAFRIRLRFLGMIAESQSEVSSEVLHCLMEGLDGKELNEVLDKLKKIVELLKSIETLLCFYQMLRMLEFLQWRQYLFQLLKEQILTQIITYLGNILFRARAKLFSPIVDMLSEGHSGGGVADCLTELASRELAEVLIESVGALDNYYLSLMAKVQRDLQNKTREQLKSLGALSKKNTTGQWLVKLRRLRQRVEYYIEQGGAVSEIRAALSKVIDEAASGVQNSIHKATSSHPRYSDYFGSYHAGGVNVSAFTS